MRQLSLASVLCLPFLAAPAAPRYASAPLVWDTAATSGWATVPGGPYDTVWVNDDEAVFEGAAGTVTIGAGLSATGLTFQATGFLLTGGVLQLNGAPRVVAGPGLSATVTGGFSASAPLEFHGGGTLALQPAAGQNNALAGGLRVSGAGSLVTLQGNNAGGSVAGSGPLVIGSNSVVRALSHNPLGQLTGAALSPLVIEGGTFEASEYVHINSVTMTGGLLGVRAGAAQVDGMDFGTRLSVPPSFTVLPSGATAVVNSTLKLRNDTVFEVADSPAAAVDLQLNNSITNAGGVTKRGAGAMVLGAATSFAGPLVVEAGVLRVRGGGANRLANNKRVVIQAGAALETSDNTNNTPTGGNAIDVVLLGGEYRFTGAGNTHQHVRNISFEQGGTFATSGAVGVYQNHNVQLNGTLTVTGAVAAVVSMANGIGLNGSHDFAVHDVTGDAADDLVFTGGGGLRNSDGNNGAVVKKGAGTLRLATIGSFTAGLTVQEGVFALDANQEANRLPANAQVTVLPGAAFEVRGVNATPTNAAGIDVTVRTNGVFRVVAGASAATGPAIGSHLHVRNITLAGGRFEGAYSGAGVAYDGENVILHGTVTAGGASPSRLESALANALQGIALNGQRTFDVADATAGPESDLVVAMELENAGGIRKTGQGTLSLAATNTYTGATAVDAGTLRVDGSLNGAGLVTVNAGGRLAGGGVINSNPGVVVAGGGTVSPDTPSGVLTVNGPVSFQSGSALALGLAGIFSHERLAAASLALDRPELQLAVGFTPADGASFLIVSNTGGAPVGGPDPRLALGGNPLDEGERFAAGGVEFTISYAGGDGNDIVLTAVVPADGDADGLPDEWETRHYGTNSVVDALSDTDGDGRRSLLEFSLATSPTNANTAADIAILHEGGPAGDWTVLRFRHRIASGRVVQVLRAGPEVGQLAELVIDGVDVRRTVANADADGDGQVELVEVRVRAAPWARRLFDLMVEVPAPAP